ncbi:hypothetical protein [Moorella sp. E306M]|uniref:hypothetical protein n=1 Tax=Moorella sp. E306M TaxID=2572683 RepID=UPI0010FFAC75|nr:hypothetical protein [Moorella sp. E306M]GEA17540.1 hypothetical protein E306M_06740 [Moorella sp. E306M]
MSLPKEELHRLVDMLPEQNVARAKRYLERLVKSVHPESAAMPRPHNKPFYIDPTCPKCGTPLVLADFLDDPNTPWENVWHDEFICPICRDYIYLDWPESERAALNEGQEEGGVSWDELKRELDL